MYLAAYLVLATALSLVVVRVYVEIEPEMDTLEVQLPGGAVKRGPVDAGPYIYDAERGDLVPAAEFSLPDGPFAVFVALDARDGQSGAEVKSVGANGAVEAADEASSGADGAGGEAADIGSTGDEQLDGAMAELGSGAPSVTDETGSDAAGAESTNNARTGDTPPQKTDGGTVYATLDDVRAGRVRLLDWGLNYNEGYEQKDILGDERYITAEDIAAYDAASRAGRTQSVQMFDEMTGSDLVGTFGEYAVSNTAYYATRTPQNAPVDMVIRMLGGLAPFAIYGVLAWVMFRRFYRVHIAAPLEELSRAADRIAGQDLDFEIARVRGRELGGLSGTLEHMRAELLRAQRALWRTAEDRRRLNAAFAHDLRTPVTVLKGTVEMARLRAGRAGTARGEAVGEDDRSTWDTLATQVERLERYATAMGGLSKLEDRAVEREPVAADVLAERIRAHARSVVVARAPELGFSCAVRGLPSASELLVGVEARGVEGSTAEPELWSSDDVESPVVMPGQSRPCGAEGQGIVSELELLGRAGGHADVSESAPSFMVDAPLVEEVLDNLLSNACAHARSHVGVEVILQGKDGMLELRVQDDGPGFSPEALHRGCDPFYSEAKSAEHFGLGLNVSRTLSNLHGGDLRLENVYPDACVGVEADEAAGARVTATFGAASD